MPFATTWIYLEDTVLNEINQTEKEEYCIISLAGKILKHQTREIEYHDGHQGP